MENRTRNTANDLFLPHILYSNYTKCNVKKIVQYTFVQTDIVFVLEY